MKNLFVSLTPIIAIPTLSIAQSLPAIRQLGPVTAVSTDSLGAVSSIRHLPNGRVLVNDIIRRRVVMFDSTLSSVTVVADTTSATANAYGKIARVMSAPRAQDVGFLVGGPFGNPGFDPNGKLVYRAPPNFAAFAPRQGTGGVPQFPTPPDSAALVRFDLATRKVDTATFFKTPQIKLIVTPSSDGVRVST